MDAVNTFFASLPHVDPVSDNQAMATFLQSHPAFDSVTYEASRGAILARIKNGPVMVVLNNQPYATYSTPGVRAAHFADSPSVPAPTVPAGRKALLFNNFHPVFDLLYKGLADISLSNMVQPLTDAGYNVERTAGSLENLKNKVTPIDSSGIGVVIFEGHGTPFERTITDSDGLPIIVSGQMYAIKTATAVNPIDDAFYGDDMKAGRVGPILTPALDDAKRFFLGKSYFITDKFVKKYWKVNADSSFIFADTCESNSDLSPPMREAMASIGCSAYVGWTGLVHPAVAFPAATYLINVMLGSRQGLDPADPPMRPFSVGEVISDMLNNGKGVSHDFINDRDVFIRLSVLGTGNTFQRFRPSIQRMFVDERNRLLSIYGNFGQNDGGTGTVKVGSTSLAIQSWSDVLIKASIPDNLIGNVVVSVRGYPSNAAPLSRWSSTIDVKQEFIGRGSEQVNTRMNLSFRGDAHGFRQSPSAAVGFNGSINLTLPERRSTATFTASGTYSDTDRGVNYTLSGSGTVKFAFDVPVIGDPGADGFGGSLEMVSGSPPTAYAYVGCVRSQCITETAVSKDGTTTDILDIGLGRQFSMPVNPTTYAGAAGQTVETVNGVRYTTKWTAFTVQNPPTSQTQRRPERQSER